MRKIVYSELDWEKRTAETIEANEMRPYNPRKKDLDWELEVEFIDAMMTLECGLDELIDNRLEIGKKYLEKRDKDDKSDDIHACERIEYVVSHYFILYYFDWFGGTVNKEAEDILKECLEMEYIDLIKNKNFRSAERKMEQMKNVRLCARFGQFELARKKFKSIQK